MDPETISADITISELGDIVPHLAEMLAQAMRADHCAVFVYSADLTTTIALFRYGYDEQLEGAHSWTDPLGPDSVPAERYLLETKQPLVRQCREDFERVPLVNPGQEIEEGRYCDLNVPLIWEDQVHGSACIWRTNDPSGYSTEEVDRAMDLGRLMAMTIVFARGYEEERQQRQRLDTLLQVASVSSSEQGLDDVLQTLARAVRTATGADVCSLYVFHEQSDDVLTAYQDGLRPDEASVFQSTFDVVSANVPAIRRMRQSMRPVLVRDFESEMARDSMLQNYMIDQDVSELLVLPVVWQQSLVGVIYAWYRREGDRFTPAAIETAEAIAYHAGGVVSRARLESMLRDQTAESEALLRIGQAVLTSEMLEPVLDEIASALEHLVPFNYACVGLLTPDRSAIRVTREWGEQYTPVIGSRLPVDASMSGIAVREGRVVVSGQVMSDSRAWKNIPKDPSLQSVMVAPLNYDNRSFGTLLLARGSHQQFTHREEQSLLLLSQQAAFAIERVQSREKLTRQADRQAFLAQVGDLLVATENPESTLQRIADLAVGVIADGAIIGLSAWEFGSLRWVADSFDDPKKAEKLHRGLHNLDMESLRRRLENALVSNRESSFSLEHIRTEHRFLREFLERLEVNHLLVIPLYQKDRAPGLLILLSRDEESPFREEEIQLGRIVAQLIGDALERQQIKRNHESLLRISEALHAQSDIAELVRTISVELNQILPCDQLIIADVDQARRMLHTQVFIHRGVERPGREYFPLDEGICGEAIANRQPLMDNQADLLDASVYASHKERTFYRREGESVLVSPLIVEDEIIGIVFVNRTGHFRFTSVDFETFLLFAGLASAALDRTTLEQHNRQLYRASTEVLAAVVDAKDPTTLEHSRHVALYSRELALLMELPDEQVERIELAGLLHDIGKLGIPDRVLQKPGRLSADEFALIKTHPDRGARILQWHPALEDLIPMVRHHHESYDGRGYPAGLEGEETPIGASIICIADAFDTITSERTYQRRRTVSEALEELERCAGTQFHPELAKRFVEHLRADPSVIQANVINDC